MLCFGLYLDIIGNMKLCEQINTEEEICVYIYIYIYIYVCVCVCVCVCVTNFNETLMGVNTRSIIVS
jgi:hypothetical protein